MCGQGLAAKEPHIFEGVMDRFLYVDILKQTLSPFIELTFPASHRFMQDNNPKHTSNDASDFMEEEGRKRA